jgi:pyridoxamine 5'-phosphate oxidase
MTEPWRTLERWFADAAAADPDFHNAATLATVDRQGQPSARVVLLKGHDRHGMEFFTNRHSRKARDIADCPRAALCLHWPRLGRQLRSEGAVTPVSDNRSDAYFASRDRASQLGAWASSQSQPLADSADLQARIAALTEQFQGRDVPRPPFWGGYILHPVLVEFWENGAARLHRRSEYRRGDHGWSVRSLYP